MTHRGPFQPLLFCDSVILRCLRREAGTGSLGTRRQLLGVSLLPPRTATQPLGTCPVALFAETPALSPHVGGCCKETTSSPFPGAGKTRGSRPGTAGPASPAQSNARRGRAGPARTQAAGSRAAPPPRDGARLDLLAALSKVLEAW